MRFELRLLSYIEVGERARAHVISVDSRESLNDVDFVYSSSSPEVVAVDPDGTLTGISNGGATLTVELDGARAEMDVQVIPTQHRRVSLRPEHPRIRFTADEIDNLRRRIRSSKPIDGPGSSFEDQLEALLTKADEFAREQEFTLTYTALDNLKQTHRVPVPQPSQIPQPEGFTDYPFWTMLSRAVEERMTTLSLAYLISHEMRYALKAKEHLLAISAWDKWYEYDKATNNLSLPHFTMGAAITCDELRDLLSTEERSKVHDSILNLGMRPMAYMFDRKDDHNGATLMNVGMITGYLAIGDELPYLDKYFNIPFDYLSWYMEQRDTSVNTEGLLYTAYAMGNLLKAASAIKRATGNERLFQYEFTSSILPELYLYFRGGQGGLANLSDSYHTDPSGIVMAILSGVTKNPIATRLAHRHRSKDLSTLIYLPDDTEPVETDLSELPNSRVFGRIGWAALRSGWTDDDTLLAFTSSPSALGHNHFDQNHFVLNVAGEWLITDPGYQNYSPGAENVFTNATIGHNALLVNGAGQQVRGRGQITGHLLSKRIDYVSGDATDAYNGTLKRWVRKVIYIKPHYFLLVDEIVPRRATDLIELLFHTQSTLALDGKNVQVGEEFGLQARQQIEIAGERARVGMQAVYPKDMRFACETYPGAERFGVYLRAKAAAASEHRVITVLQPCNPGHKLVPLVVEATPDGETLQLIVDRHTEIDLHLFGPQRSTGVPGSSDGEFSCSGEQATIVTEKLTGTISRVVMVNGTRLLARSEVLLWADRPSHLYVEYSSDSEARVHSWLSEASRVGIRVAYSPRVIVDGIEWSDSRFQYNGQTKMIYLSLNAGEHEVLLGRR